MADITPLFQAFVAPAIFISAAALLVLSLNVRLMGMVTRLRQFLHDKHLAATAGRLQEAEALADQIASIEGRAEKIRKAFLFTLLCLIGAIATCLLLGLGLYWAHAQVLAVFVFVVAILALLIGTIFYIAEVVVALSSVHDEAKYFHLIDLSARARSEEKTAAGEPESWHRPG